MKLLPATLSLAAVCGASRLSAAEDVCAPANKGVVVSVNFEASQVGSDVLARGGNAIDAAIATALALAVTHPAAGNIGGGGFMVVFPTDGEPTTFDFRETAPAAATREMFVEEGSRAAHRRVGVPGTLRGLELAHRRFGSLPWSDLVAPASALARDGFALDAAGAEALNEVLGEEGGAELDELRRVFGKPGGGVWRKGDRLVQPDLAATLAIIRQEGADAFYAGRVAEQLVAEMRRGDGLITLADLAAYRAIERRPLRSTYRGYDVYCMPPPSSGGTTLLEALHMLESFDLKHEGRWSPQTLHLMAEAMKRSFRDRAAHLGDPDFVDIPRDLISKEHARKLSATIDPARSTPSRELAGEIPLAPEGEQTTHLSVVDGRGAAVALTYTLEQSFGGKVVVRGAGFLLNDEMNDFNWRPGVTDSTGRIGTAANLIAPGKRMLSSMCPTILAKEGRPVLITGSPGGRTIINTVLCTIVNVVDFEMDVQAAVAAPRMHHQWLPDVLVVEDRLADEHPAAMAALGKMGHRVERGGKQGDAHSIAINPRTGERIGAPDRRIAGHASTEP